MSGSDIPVPPEDLRWRVVGNRNGDDFVNSGPPTVKYFDRLVRMVNKKGISEFESILDWGCGCGRLIRAMPDVTNASLYGSDIDSEAIEWCQNNLFFAEFTVASEFPPLVYGDNKFDLVYATSVLTHLDEEHQCAWLSELQRIIKFGGYAILTFKSYENLLRIEDLERKNQVMSELGETGFLYTNAPIWKEVFPQYYQDAYHTYDYILSEWGKYFEVLAITPPQVLQQYSVLLQKR